MTARVKPRTDDPKPGPFKVGTRLRYKGDKTITMGRSGGKMVTVLHPGIEVTINKCSYGHRGTGRRIDDPDDPEPIYDETEDQVSVYYIPGTEEGRCISHESAHEWEVI